MDAKAQQRLFKEADVVPGTKARLLLEQARDLDRCLSGTPVCAEDKERQQLEVAHASTLSQMGAVADELDVESERERLQNDHTKTMREIDSVMDGLDAWREQRRAEADAFADRMLKLDEDRGHARACSASVEPSADDVALGQLQRLAEKREDRPTWRPGAGPSLGRSVRAAPPSALHAAEQPSLAACFSDASGLAHLQRELARSMREMEAQASGDSMDGACDAIQDRLSRFDADLDDVMQRLAASGRKGPEMSDGSGTETPGAADKCGAGAGDELCDADAK
eukprot:g1950.t1